MSATTSKGIPRNFPESALRDEALLKHEALTTAVAKGGLLPMVIGLLVALVGIFYVSQQNLTPQELQEQSRSIGVLLGPFKFLAPLVVAVYYQFSLPISILIGVLCLIGIGVSLYQISKPLSVSCPACKREYTLAHTKTYRFACPECLALIYGTRGSEQKELHCDYCGLDYQGPSAGPQVCPSCLYQPSNTKENSCPECKTSIPAGVTYCKSCNAWLGVVEDTALQRKADQLRLGKYADVCALSYPACLAYTLHRCKLVGEDIKAFNGITGLSNIGELQEARKVGRRILACLLGIQWVYRSGKNLPVEVLNDFKSSIATFRGKIKALVPEASTGGGPSFAVATELSPIADEAEGELSPLLREAEMTVAAALEQTVIAEQPLSNQGSSSSVKS